MLSALAFITIVPCLNVPLLLFQCSLNNADCANDYVARLTSSLQIDLSGLVSTRNEHDREKVESCLAGFSVVAAKLKAVLEQVICFIQPR